ncbi:hypothetical protein [Anaerovibrio sp.]|uniref:phage tail assembly chaperone n=1 Tax=Anaerovibrio sp. TaxID=1872532 RepID=UPI0025BAABED|nr:hypothetical protein [Anaerovibrio sp.]MBR2143773.1 hypothetical protein [Anaerovibrio sp.]
MENKMDLQAFLMQNAIAAPVIEYVASKRFVANGNPVAWKIQPITNEENDEILSQCKKKSFIPGTREIQVTTDQDKYAAMVLAKCIVYPNLNDAALQDSYQAVGAEELIKKMLTPGEYTNLFLAVQNANGFDTGMDEKIKEAKN